MANTDNSCSALEVKDFYKDSETHLADIWEHQKYMQEEVYGYDFENMSLRDIMNFWHMNNHAMIDEMHEMTDALGGIKDGDGSAIWKKWKKAHSKFDDLKIDDLSEDDKAELYFEFVDILHFFMNYAISMKLDPKLMYNMYFAKAEENRNRQKKGY